MLTVRVTVQSRPDYTNRPCLLLHSHDLANRKSPRGRVCRLLLGFNRGRPVMMVYSRSAESTNDLPYTWSHGFVTYTSCAGAMLPMLLHPGSGGLTKTSVACHQQRGWDLGTSVPSASNSANAPYKAPAGFPRTLFARIINQPRKVCST